MPQTTYLPAFQAGYPILAKVQKPGGVTVSTTATPPRVPNKPTYAAGTIQSLETYMAEVAEWDEKQAQARAAQEEAVVEEPEEHEEEEVEEDDGNGGTVKRRRPKSRRR